MVLERIIAKSKSNKPALKVRFMREIKILLMRKCPDLQKRVQESGKRSISKDINYRICDLDILGICNYKIFYWWSPFYIIVFIWNIFLSNRVVDIQRTVIAFLTSFYFPSGGCIFLMILFNYYLSRMIVSIFYF